MAAMTTNSSVPPAVPAGKPGKGKFPAAKKGSGPAKGKKGVNPFAKKGAAPAGKPAAKGGPIDMKTLSSMKDSLKSV